MKLKLENKTLKKMIAVAVAAFLFLLAQSWIISPNAGKLIRILRVKSPMERGVGKLHYVLQLGFIPLANLTFENETSMVRGEKFCEAKLWIRPWGWLIVVSHDRIGQMFHTVVNLKNELPVQYEENSLDHQKRKRSHHWILYDHEHLVMERRGKKEDIEFDTRDPLATIVWLMNEDYKGHKLLKTTFNISRRIYLLVGKVLERGPQAGAKGGADLIHLKLSLTPLSEENTGQSSLVDVYLGKQAETYVPLLVRFRLGIFRFLVALEKF